MLYCSTGMLPSFALLYKSNLVLEDWIIPLVIQGHFKDLCVTILVINGKHLLYREFTMRQKLLVLIFISALESSSVHVSLVSSEWNFVLFFKLKSRNLIFNLGWSLLKCEARINTGKWSDILNFKIPEITLGRQFVKMLSRRDGLPLWLISGNLVGREMSGK